MTCYPYINDMTLFTYNAIQNVFRNAGNVSVTLRDPVGLSMYKISLLQQILFLSVDFQGDHKTHKVEASVEPVSIL